MPMWRSAIISVLCSLIYSAVSLGMGCGIMGI